MTRRRPLLFWILLAAFAGLAAWWLLYVPYRPDQLFAAIPADASVVSVHQGLNARWSTLAQNPITLSLFRSFGLDAAAVRAVAADPQTRLWLDKLASDRSIIAFVPRLPSSGEPGWVFATWLGGQSQRLRWQLMLSKPTGFKRVNLRPGTTYWIMANTAFRPDLRVAIAFVEGMLLGCVSTDSHDIADVIQTCEGRLPAVDSTPEFRVFQRMMAASRAPDRGWLAMARPGAEAALAPGIVGCELTGLASNRLQGRLSLAYAMPGAAPAAPLATAGLEAVLGDAPQALIVGRPAQLFALVPPAFAHPWRELAEELVAQQKADTAVLALTGEDFSGRLFGLKVPGLLIGLPLADAEGAVTWLRGALERLNAQYRWGLIPWEVEAGTNRLYVIDGTAARIYDRLTLNEKPACAACGGWFWMASNLDVLRKLVQRFGPAEARKAAPPPPWLARLKPEDAALLAWTDLDRGGKTLRLALSTYTLKLRLEDPFGSSSGSALQTIDELKAWIDALAPLGTVEGNLRQDGDFARLTFQIGAPP